MEHVLFFLALALREKAHYPFKRAGTGVFQKIQSVHDFLVKIFMNPKKLIKACDEETISKLNKLKDLLYELIEEYKADFMRISHFNSIIDKIRDIFYKKRLSERNSLKELSIITNMVSYWSKKDDILEKYKNGYIQLLKTIRSWRRKLFVFKNHPIIPNTNNSIETLFKEKKSWMRRTSGVKFGNKTFSLYGNYIIFVDTNQSYEQILQFLQNVDYSQIDSKIKFEKQKAHKRKFIRDKLNNWNDYFIERSQKLILSLKLY